MINCRNMIHNEHPIPLKKPETEVIEIFTHEVPDRKMGDDDSFVPIYMYTILHSPLLHV